MKLQGDCDGDERTRDRSRVHREAATTVRDRDREDAVPQREACGSRCRRRAVDRIDEQVRTAIRRERVEMKQPDRGRLRILGGTEEALEIGEEVNRVNTDDCRQTAKE